MITREQIDEHCKSGLLWAKLDRDYKADRLDYVLPAGTIVQVELYTTSQADLRVNDEWVDNNFPYDSATLLEDE